MLIEFTSIRVECFTLRRYFALINLVILLNNINDLNKIFVETKLL